MSMAEHILKVPMPCCGTIMGAVAHSKVLWRICRRLLDSRWVQSQLLLMNRHPKVAVTGWLILNAKCQSSSLRVALPSSFVHPCAKPNSIFNVLLTGGIILDCLQPSGDIIMGSLIGRIDSVLTRLDVDHSAPERDCTSISTSRSPFKVNSPVSTNGIRASRLCIAPYHNHYRTAAHRPYPA